MKDCYAINYIDEDTLFAKSITNSCNLWGSYNHDDGIDLYFDDDSATGSNAGGLATGIGGTALIVSGLFTTPLFEAFTIETDILIHEMGHCLGLWHTHHGTAQEEGTLCDGTEVEPGTAEDVSGEDCGKTGDYICDTPADPGLGYYVTGPPDCEWIFPHDDFEPLTDNFMSYTSPSCMTSFTPNQYSRMRCVSYNQAFLKQRQYQVLETQEAEISSNTNWQINTAPYDGNFIIEDKLVIKSGQSLTIGYDVLVRFAENAKLVIEPNATLNLYGKLTSVNCESTWQGVKVYGNADAGQDYDSQSSGYHQGLFRGYERSVVENAVTAVELWGPTQDDTGGRIFCTETTFNNNKNGVFFLPYENSYLGQPRPYRASFKECAFTVDNFTPFKSLDIHAGLFGVDGIRFIGCTFDGYIDLLSTEQSDQGYGIAAVNSGFSVLAKSSQSTEICAPPCIDMKPTVFNRLGFGIWVSSYAENRLFKVYQADFNDCYTGIEVDGVSAGVMLFNNFYMGSVSDPNVMNGDQVGVKLNHFIAGFTLEENTFSATNGNVNNTIGIAVENLGEMNSVIRRNTFSGLTIANEAFGKNAGVGQQGQFFGLRYICNGNSNIASKDFFVDDSEMYGTNNISALQSDIGNDLPIATGNSFSSTGDPLNGDFANFGDLIEEYHFNPSNVGEVPDATTGIDDKLQSIANSCLQTYCAPPCLDNNALADLYSEYYTNRSSYDVAIAMSDWRTASVHKVQMDRASKLAVQHHLADTSTFDRDSLRVWFSNALSISGDILLAKDYAAEGDYANANQVFSAISSKFTLNAQEQSDITDIQTIFGIMSVRTVADMTQNDINVLLDISDNPGHASAMARAILISHGYRFGTNYVLPSPSGQQLISTSDASTINEFTEVTIYPNPVSGDFVNIVIPEADRYEEMRVDMWTMTGMKVLSKKIPGFRSTLIIPNSINGVFVYRITADGESIKSGRILIIR